MSSCPLRMERSVILFVVHVLCSVPLVSSFDHRWVAQIESGQNCSSSLHIPIDTHSDSISETFECPTWYSFNSTKGLCTFGDSLGGVVESTASTLQSSIQHLYCMTNTAFEQWYLWLGNVYIHLWYFIGQAFLFHAMFLC